MILSVIDYLLPLLLLFLLLLLQQQQQQQQLQQDGVEAKKEIMIVPPLIAALKDQCRSLGVQYVDRGPTYRPYFVSSEGVSGNS